MDATYFPTFSDSDTLALWLFDERTYGYTTLTDASGARVWPSAASGSTGSSRSTPGIEVSR